MHKPAVAGIAVMLCLVGIASAEELPPRIKAVQQYLLEQDYPVLFGDTPYRIKAEDVVEGGSGVLAGPVGPARSLVAAGWPSAPDGA